MGAQHRRILGFDQEETQRHQPSDMTQTTSVTSCVTRFEPAKGERNPVPKA